MNTEIEKRIRDEQEGLAHGTMNWWQKVDILLKTIDEHRAELACALEEEKNSIKDERDQLAKLREEIEKLIAERDSWKYIALQTREIANEAFERLAIRYGYQPTGPTLDSSKPPNAIA